MPRRSKGPAKCHTCQRRIKWLKSPFTGGWRSFEPEAVNPHAHTGPPAFPVENLRAYVPRELVEELMVRREQSRSEATEEAYAFEWYVPHTCPTTDPTTSTGGGGEE